MSEVITTAANSVSNWREQEIFVKRINYLSKSSLPVLPWLSCHDLTMILP